MPQGAAGGHSPPQAATARPDTLAQEPKKSWKSIKLSIFHEKSMTNALIATQTPKLSSQGVPDVILVLKRDRSLLQTYENTPVFITFQYIIRMPSWTASNEFLILKTR